MRVVSKMATGGATRPLPQRLTVHRALQIGGTALAERRS
jgi:hypothetical protein